MKYTSISANLRIMSFQTASKAYEVGKGKPAQSNELRIARGYHCSYKKDDTYKKYLSGQDVCRYYNKWSGEFLSYGNWLSAPRCSVPFNEPRILVRQIPSKPPNSINAVYMVDEYLNDSNSMVIFSFKKCDPLYLLAVLNSKIITFWFVHTFDKFQRKIFPQFKVKELATFPIPNTDEIEQKKVASKARRMIDLHVILEKNQINSDKSHDIKYEISKLDDEINSEICRLYGL